MIHIRQVNASAAPIEIRQDLNCDKNTSFLGAVDYLNQE